MSAIILDGRAISAEIKQELKADVAALKARYGIAPTIATVQVGADPASVVYAKRIARAHRELGMECRSLELPTDATEQDLVSVIHGLGEDAAIHGILPLLPLPAPLRAEVAALAVNPAKDVDGVSPVSAGRLYMGMDTFVPNTPAGGMEMLRRAGIGLPGKRAVVVGRSNVVGKPMALLMLNQDATVTVCHSRTSDVPAICREAEILVVGVGRPGLVRGSWIRSGAAVLDFGINSVDGRVVGDVDFAEAVEVAGWLTPVPGGTGPVTNLMLCRNTLKAARALLETP